MNHPSKQDTNMTETNTTKNTASLSVAAEKNDRVVKEITRLVLRRRTGQLSSAESARLQLLGEIVDCNVKSKVVLEKCRSHKSDDLISKIEQEGFGVIASFQSHGFNCYVFRHPTRLSLNGYITIPTSHPFHGLSYHDIISCQHHMDSNRRLQGLCKVFPVEWTYAGDALPKPVSVLVDLPIDGPDPSDWVFGFDCAHMMDLVPVWENRLVLSEPHTPTYKDKSFVAKKLIECAKIFAVSLDIDCDTVQKVVDDSKNRDHTITVREFLIRILESYESQLEQRES